MSSHPASTWTPTCVARARTTVVRACAEGPAYRISVSAPEGPAPADGFPALVVLDGNALFATVADTERRLSHRPGKTGAVPTVIIGVGHDGPGLYDPVQRHRDFTSGPAAGGGACAHPVGGAAAFRDVLVDQVLPLAAGRAPLDRRRIGLMGHSLAGGFVLETLADHPEAFSIYAAISPSLWWNAEGLTARLRALPADAADTVLLAVGEREQSDADPGRRMVDGVRALGAVLAAGPLGARAQTLVAADEDHASVVPATISRVLRLFDRA